ncbi:hypothetical protein M9H77_17950 [Catharanthus roseus]|uniref:Uncharacterized protein n=1 Tax=Catharanthus roseus TaxID=4058 RepID=A0ACC0B639_CATRO|nr:hypothetical protein M9H77_17950 [Catharanthus roseus]
MSESTSLLSQKKKKETDNNYAEWARAMRMALRSKKKLGFIDRIIPIPEAGHDGTGCFQLVGYPDWWPRNSSQLAGRGFSSANHNKSWRGGRSGRGGRQHPPMPRPHATDRGRPLEAWAYSASVWQARTAMENFSRNRHAGEEEGRGPGGPIYSDRPGSGPSSSSNGPGSAGPGPGPFPALTVDQWSTLLTALQTSSNTQSEKLSGMENVF